MTQRVIGGNTYNLSYDAENRLVSVSGPSLSASFVYDGDGNRVQSTIGSTTTTFVGNYYETDGATVTQYYYGGASRVAMRTCTDASCATFTLYYLFSDQLGSTSVTVNASTGDTTELRYTAWGSVRYSDGTTATNYQYTGQYAYESLGLDFYQSRFYDDALGRFISADTVVPGGVQGYDRYVYANNNPILYNDPTGHSSCVGAHADDGPDCAKKEWSDVHIQIEIKKHQDKVERDILDSIDNLDFGNGTIQLGFGINGFRWPGVRGDLAIALDFKGNLALLATGGAGGYTAAGGGLGPYFATTDAPSVHYLEGNNVQIGGQVGEAETVGAEAVLFRGPNRDGYWGLSISDQARLQGPWPGEFHATATHTTTLVQLDIPHLIVKAIVGIFGSPGIYDTEP